jgi:hypothetical protein
MAFVAALTLLAATVATASAQEVTYADGRVTAHFDRVPREAAIAALAEEAGAEVEGEPLEPGEVSGHFDGMRFRDALDWLLGDQNFTVSYDAAGRPRRVVLWGQPVKAVVPPVGGRGKGFAAAVTRHPRIVLPPPLAEALRTPETSLSQLLRRGARHPDPAIRDAAVALFVQTLASNREFDTALLRTDDPTLLSLIRNWAGDGAEAVFARMATHGGDPMLRSRSERLLADMRSGTGLPRPPSIH